jgi:hypothetical protein
VRQNKQTEMPQGKLYFIDHFPKTIAKSRYNKQKLAALDSGKQRTQWIKSIYSHKGNNKKGQRQRLLPGKLEDMAKERHKTSCSTSQAFF